MMFNIAIGVLGIVISSLAGLTTPVSVSEWLKSAIVENDAGIMPQ
jgi:hypothetical protein